METRTIKLRKSKKVSLRPSHPWIYKSWISAARSSASPGALVSVIGPDGKFVGNGYYNPESQIAVRLLTFSDEKIDHAFFTRRIKESFEKRRHLLSQTNAFRAVFSESDCLPGLIVDVYSDTAVFSVLTLGMERLKDTLTKSISEALNPKYIYERSDSNIRELEGLLPIKRWHGKEGPSVIEIFENEVKFYVDIENGHKTGFYLDQRKSRYLSRAISPGKKVLDIFCYTGGFSINAAISGAKDVYAVDIKQQWLDLSARNAQLNGVSQKIKFIKSDSFTFLENMVSSGEYADVVILDPPSFLKSRESIKSAAKGYEFLNFQAMKILSQDGILCTFSCSHHMRQDMFSDILKSAAKSAKKSFEVLNTCHQAQDHPIVKGIQETEYLKGYFLRVRSG
ncbi:MAG: class I SAM-dependent rRNA methyltransferase [Candidatus Omnitrophota bacterium]